MPGYALGGEINYTDGRFTSGKDTDPATTLHGGVWHEQLAKLFLGLPAATASLDGGFDYAYGGATTQDGTRELDFTSDVGITVQQHGRAGQRLPGQVPHDGPRRALHRVGRRRTTSS